MRRDPTSCVAYIIVTKMDVVTCGRECDHRPPHRGKFREIFLHWTGPSGRR